MKVNELQLLYYYSCFLFLSASVSFNQLNFYSRRYDVTYCVLKDLMLKSSANAKMLPGLIPCNNYVFRKEITVIFYLENIFFHFNTPSYTFKKHQIYASTQICKWDCILCHIYQHSNHGELEPRRTRTRTLAISN